MASLIQIVRYLDKYLRVGEIEDWPNALNGLQIENSGRITKIGAAVDVSTRVLREAAKKDVDLLFVHQDRKSTRLNSSHRTISYAVFCLKKKKKKKIQNIYKK